MTHRSLARPGVAAIWMLVVFALLTVLVTTITWHHLTNRRLVDQRYKQLQAIWLARAGIELAATQLLTDPADHVEKSATPVPGSQVRYRIRKEPGSTDIYQVESEARFGTDEPRPVLRSQMRRFRRIVDKNQVRLEPVTAMAEHIK